MEKKTKIAKENIVLVSKDDSETIIQQKKESEN